MKKLKFAPESRGCFTDELATKYEITKEEMRLLPYLLFCCVDHTCLIKARMSNEEIEIAERWESEGKIAQPFVKCAFASLEFYEKVTKILWDAYVYHTKS